MRGETTIHIQASPEAVYDVVSDLTRMGEWSPECYRCEWVHGWTGAAVGARFRGYNRRGRVKWKTSGMVAVADPGREFTFATALFGKLPATRWTYRLRDSGGGTEVTESYEAPEAGRLILLHRWRASELQQAMRTTLEHIKRTVEGDNGAPPAPEPRS